MFAALTLHSIKFSNAAMERQKIENDNPGYYAIIPVIILERKDLRPNAKLLYAEISSLTKKTGECFATNKYLAEALGITETAVIDLIRILKQKELIIVTTRKDGEGTHRTITLQLTSPSIRTPTPVKVSTNPPVQVNGDPIIDNNILDYNKDKLNNIAVSKETGKEVNNLIYLFKSVNPSYESLFSMKTQRSAVQRLIKALGLQKLENIIKTLEQTNKLDYFPVITTPLQLESKVGQLIASVQKKINSPNILVL